MVAVAVAVAEEEGVGGEEEVAAQYNTEEEGSLEAPELVALEYQVPQYNRVGVV